MRERARALVLFPSHFSGDLCSLRFDGSPCPTMQRFFFVSFLLVLRLSAILTVVIRLITTRTMLVLRRRVAHSLLTLYLSAAASADIAAEFNTSYTG